MAGRAHVLQPLDAATNVGLVRAAGLVVEEAEAVPETEPDGATVRFLWVVARKAERGPA